MVKGFFKDLKATAAKLGFSDPLWLKEDADPVFEVVETQGTGPQLLLLHGLLGQVSNWEYVTPHLAKHTNPIALKFPLLTAPKSDVKVKSLSLFAEAYIRERQIGPAAVCGNSLGGHVALRLALARPELVDCMILSGSSGLYEHTVDSLPLRPDERFVREHMARVFVNNEFITEEAIAQMVEILDSRHNIGNLLSAAKSAKRDNLYDLLPQITCPVLLLWGEDDTITTMDVAETFQRRLPNAKLVSQKKCGHAPMIEHPEWFSEEIDKFLHEHSRFYKK
jgi:pimeloyl-ACP methyl ester carboxylesterase